MSIDPILAAAGAGPQVDVPPHWGQGRATFGGLQAAILLARLQALVPAGRPLRSFSMSFVGPIAPGAVEVPAQIIRSGKSVTQAECRIVQNGEVQAVMLASFGAGRPSQINVAPASAPVFAPVGQGRRLPFLPGMMPEFLQKFDMEWAVGALPYAGSDETELGGWVRFSEPTGKPTVAHLAALMDSWPPSVLGMYKAPAPNSSLTWTLEFMDVDLGDDGQAWWQYLATTDIAGDGYAHISARMWRADGTLVAIGRQTASIFA